MTDIPIGWALRNDLARQVASPARNYRDAGDLLPAACLKRIRYRAQTPVDHAAAFQAHSAISHSNALGNAPMPPQSADAAPFQGEG